MSAFFLSEEQRQLREMAHEFADREIRPVAWNHDRTGEWPADLVTRGWELGLMNRRIPAELGGVGLSHLDNALVTEELAWGCAAVEAVLNTNDVSATALLLAGSPSLQRHYITRLTEAPRFASFCMSEPDAGSDVSMLRTTAKRRGAGWVINGSKVFVTNGAHADWYLVFAKTDPAAGAKGISAFVVPREAGVEVGTKEDKMGQRAAETVSLALEEVEVPADHLVGEKNKGFSLAMMALDRSRPVVAAMATGVARAAMELAVEYARERVQFGRPIARLQAIQFLIADMATDVEVSRLLTWKSAAYLDVGRANTLISAHAKRYAADAAMRVATDAVQVHGGYGYIREYRVEKLMRDAKVMQLYEGTSQIQRLVIARHVLG